MDCTWVSSWSRSMSQKCGPQYAWLSGLPQTSSTLDTPWNFRSATMAPLYSHTGLVGLIPKGRWWLSWLNHPYGQNLGSLIRIKLENPIKWMEASQFFSSKESAPSTMCCEDNVYCDVWDRRGNTAPCCTSKADSKHCLLLHVPAAPPSSSAQEKMMILDGTETHHSSWQCKESHPYCCHGPLVLLAMGESGTATVLTRYMISLPIERTTARNSVQHKRRTYPCYRAVITEHQQRWTHWWCTIPSQHLAKGDK